MKKHILIGLAAVGIWLFASTQAMAVHKGAGDLTCGNCHTIHNSQGGSQLNGVGSPADGSLLLLRGNVTSRADIHNFCLQCHASDGSRGNTLLGPHNNTAPKVLLANSNTSTGWNMDKTFNFIGAGGDFSYACGGAGVGGVYTCTDNTNALGKGHSIGSPTATPPGNADGAVTDFTCVTCHDPHGTDNIASGDINKFRNLRKIPRHSGTDSVALATDGSFGSWVGGITGKSGAGGNYVGVDATTGASSGQGASIFTNIWPVINQAPVGNITGDLGHSNWYGSGAIAGDATDGTGGMSLWCAACHDKWHEVKMIALGGNNINGLDFNRHPVDWGIEYLADGSEPGQPVNTGYQGGWSGDDVYILDPANYDAAIAGQSIPVSNNRQHGALALNGGNSLVVNGINQGVYYLSKGAPGSGDQGNGAVMCLSCHFAHGGPYNDNLRWDYTSAVSAGAQTGNGVPSTRGCQLCHNRGA